jgi:hypothetical protein
MLCVNWPLEARDVCHLQNVETGPGAHPAFHSVGTGAIFHQFSGQGVKLITHHLALLLRMSGAIPFFPLYAFMPWTEETLPLPLHYVLPRFGTHVRTHNVWNTWEHNVWNTWEHIMFGTHMRTHNVWNTRENTVFGTHVRTHGVSLEILLVPGYMGRLC